MFKTLLAITQSKEKDKGIIMSIGKIPPFKLGDAVSIRIGPYKGQDGTVISFADGYPRQWVMVRTASGESLMFDWIELEKK